MDMSDGAILAARRRVDAVDNINCKSIQLEALLVTLMHAARSADGLPSEYLESVCWLASDLASDIKKSAVELG